MAISPSNNLVPSRLPRADFPSPKPSRSAEAASALPAEQDSIAAHPRADSLPRSPGPQPLAEAFQIASLGTTGVNISSGFARPTVGRSAPATLERRAETGYDEWIVKFKAGWNERVAPLKERFDDPDTHRRLDRLRDRIAPEWAKDNDIRTISTSDVRRWARKMKKPDTLAEMNDTLKAIELEVEEKLARARRRG